MFMSCGTSPHPHPAIHSVQWHWVAGWGCGLVPTNRKIRQPTQPMPPHNRSMIWPMVTPSVWAAKFSAMR